jgi:hypothetical protein
MELKVKRISLKQTIAQGIEQTWKYMDQSGGETGHLVIFDPDKSRSWAKKIFVREEEFQGTKIKVWGL